MTEASDSWILISIWNRLNIGQNQFIIKYTEAGGKYMKMWNSSVSLTKCVWTYDISNYRGPPPLIPFNGMCTRLGALEYMFYVRYAWKRASAHLLSNVKDDMEGRSRPWYKVWWDLPGILRSIYHSRTWGYHTSYSTSRLWHGKYEYTSSPIHQKQYSGSFHFRC